MSKLLYTIMWDREPLTVDAFSEEFDVALHEIDRDFGVVEIDPQAHLYAVMIEEAAVNRLSGKQATEDKGVSGPYDNPVIEPFGPPRLPKKGDDSSLV
ncbi:MAG: hypothetical protein SF123_21820 [Chloroflexota bacterium]|nr:hypothetical protein [Chloroflexota bacterium]